MPRKKSLDSKVESALDKQLDNIDNLEPAVRMTCIKLGIQLMMVQHKIKEGDGFGSEFDTGDKSDD
jgi:hypothetical protein